MVWYDEKAVEIRGEKTERADEREWRIARALDIPPEYKNIYVFSLDDLDPICKIQEEHFYQFVFKSIKDSGLYHPLIIYPIHVTEWKEELKTDYHQTPPPMGEGENPWRLRVQCGCNRYYALKELGYDAVECIVEETLKTAQDYAHILRCDKKWQRPSNMELIKQGKRWS